MAQRGGSADLPLHHGKVPEWLAGRMAKLGADHRRGDRPGLWPRRVPAPARQSLLVPVVRRGDGDGLAFVRHHHQRHRRAEARAGAARKGARPPCLRRTRQAFAQDAGRSCSTIGQRVGFDGAALAQASRLVAKVDSAAVQDGFELYLHGFIVADDGKWVVVQQGMKDETGTGAALSLAVRGPAQASSRRRTARSRATGRATSSTSPIVRAAQARTASVDLLGDIGPGRHRRARSGRIEGRDARPADERRADAAVSGHAGASRRPRPRT